MNIYKAFEECYLNEELVSNFNRLSGGNFSPKDRRAPIDRLVDEACGHVPITKDDEAFMKFFLDSIWFRLPDDGFVK